MTLLFLPAGLGAPRPSFAAATGPSAAFARLWLAAQRLPPDRELLSVFVDDFVKLTGLDRPSAPGGRLAPIATLPLASTYPEEPASPP